MDLARVMQSTFEANAASGTLSLQGEANILELSEILNSSVLLTPPREFNNVLSAGDHFPSLSDNQSLVDSNILPSSISPRRLFLDRNMAQSSAFHPDTALASESTTNTSHLSPVQLQLMNIDRPIIPRVSGRRTAGIHAGLDQDTSTRPSPLSVSLNTLSTLPLLSEDPEFPTETTIAMNHPFPNRIKMPLISNAETSEVVSSSRVLRPRGIKVAALQMPSVSEKAEKGSRKVKPLDSPPPAPFSGYANPAFQRPVIPRVSHTERLRRTTAHSLSPLPDVSMSSEPQDQVTLEMKREAVEEDFAMFNSTFDVSLGDPSMQLEDSPMRDVDMPSNISSKQDLNIPTIPQVDQQQVFPITALSDKIHIPKIPRVERPRKVQSNEDIIPSTSPGIDGPQRVSHSEPPTVLHRVQAQVNNLPHTATLPAVGGFPTGDMLAVIESLLDRTSNEPVHTLRSHRDAQQDRIQGLRTLIRDGEDLARLQNVFIHTSLAEEHLRKVLERMRDDGLEVDGYIDEVAEEVRIAAASLPG